MGGLNDGMEPGDLVDTPFGKGLVREVRNGGRVMVEVRGRAMEFESGQVSHAQPPKLRARRRERRARGQDAQPADWSSPRGLPTEVDLHGLTVAEALVKAELALNDALLANLPELRLIHGRSGGRIRGALHRWLGGVAAVRGFRIDPRNPGTTIVQL